MLDGYVQAFPGNRFEIARTVVSGNSIVVEGVWIGKHTGPMILPDGSTVPASGRSVRVPYATLFTLEGDRISSHHAYWDMASFLGQLGLFAR
jgi:predicted ester cyclase